MRIRWTRSAERHLVEIFEYVAADRPGAARRLMARLSSTVAQLADHPYSGRTVPEIDDPRIRERIVAPYRVLYAVGEEVVILGVYHSSRLLPENPDDLE